MKKPLPLLIVLLATLCILPAFRIHAQAKWTFMVYLDADNNLESFGIKDFNEMELVGSSVEMNIIVQIDRAPGYDNSNGNWTGARRYVVTQDNNTGSIASSMVDDLGEVNMGDPNTLTSFIQWAASSHPADHYALVLWDHGGGWQKKKATLNQLKFAPSSKDAPIGIDSRGLPFNPVISSEPHGITGIPGAGKFSETLLRLQQGSVNAANILKNVCSDETDGDILYNHEISSAIANAGIHFDVIGFDACLMAMIENAYPLRNLGDYMVASEQTVPADGWPYDLILSELLFDPDMSPEDFAKLIVQKYGQFYVSGEPGTHSAIDLSLVSNVASKLDAFTAAITDNDNLWSQVDQSRSAADKYYIPEHKDLWHIADLISQLSDDGTVDATAADLKAAISGSVLQNFATTPEFANSRGLAIYFPDATNYNAHYSEEENGIDFMQENQWDEFLTAYFNGANGGGPQDPDIDYGKDVYEPNNNLALAYGPLKNDNQYVGYLPDDEDFDLYRIEIPSDADISVDLSVPADFDLYLLQPDGSDLNVLASSEQSGNSPEGLEGNIGAGVYYLAVTPFDISEEPYVLTLGGVAETTEPVLYNTTLAYDFGSPPFYIWGTALGDAAGCLYKLPAIPATLNRVWINFQDLDAEGLGGDGTFYLTALDYYGYLLPDTVLQLTPPDTGWVYVDLAAQNISLNGDFVVAVMYDGFNTPGIGYDTNKSYGNNLFFSSDFESGYEEDPGTYFIRAEIEYYASNFTTGNTNVILEPSSVIAFPNPFMESVRLEYLLKQPGDVEIYITDLQGRAVSREILRNQPAGQNTHQLNGTGLSPGMYLVTLKTDGQFIQKKLVRH